MEQDIFYLLLTFYYNSYSIECKYLPAAVAGFGFPENSARERDIENTAPVYHKC